MKKVTFLSLLVLGIGTAFLAVGLLLFLTDDNGTGEPLASEQAAASDHSSHDEGQAGAASDDEEEATDGSDHEDTAADDGEHEIVMTLRTENVKFVPDTIRVKVGETIRLTLDNHDAFLHDYTVDEPEFVVVEASGTDHAEHESVAHEEGDGTDAQVSLQPLHIAADGNQHADLVFKATEPGEYEFYCSVPGHREAGMVGTIIVEE